jgi:glutamate---cysteine ligase / carboxylate-amine ligase
MVHVLNDPFLYYIRVSVARLVWTTRHAGRMDVRSVGVEEELLLVEPGTGRPRAVAGAVLRAADGPPPAAPGRAGAPSLDFELQLQQVETATEPCTSIDGLYRELIRCRMAAAAAAERSGVAVAAVATSPVPTEPRVTGKPRYQEMAAAFGLTAQEQLTCGCHVHVSVSDDEEGVAALDRIQPWLAPLLALSANSPFWQGTDSSYASFRYQAWGRWPCSGPTEWFGSAPVYQEAVELMVATGTLLDAGMVYFDARLSRRYPTLEVRIADVCLRAQDAALIAALTRALVETEARAWRRGEPGRPVRAELLRLAAWQASRSGLDGDLLHPVTFRPVPAAAAAGLLVEHVGEALHDAGDHPTVTALLREVLGRGNGAAFQRAAFARTGSPAGVAAEAAEVTGGPRN